MEICGAPPAHVLDAASRRKLFFDDEYQPALKPNSRGKLRRPLTKTLPGVLRCSDKSFLKFLAACFEWDPENRIKPDEALKHEWIIEGLPPKVLQQHQRMLGLPGISHTNSQRTLSKGARTQKLQGISNLAHEAGAVAAHHF